MLGLLDAGVSVAYHAVTVLDQFLAPLGGGLAAVAAIVACTVAIRLLLVPLSYYALGGQAGQAPPGGAVAALTRVVPYGTAVVALFVPLAAGVYLLTTTAWTLAERAALGRRAQEAADRSAAARARTAVS